MRRILPAAVLAIIFHAALLGIDRGLFFDNTTIMPKSSVVTVTMSYRQPEPVNEIKKEPVKRPKAEPEETVKIPDEPELPPPEETVMVPHEPETPSSEETEEIIEPDESAEESSDEQPSQEENQGDDDSHMRVEQEAFPLYKINPPPRYPKMAIRRGYQGSVVLSVFVDEKGQVKNLWVFASSGYRLLDKAAVKAAGNWAFEPGMKGNRKVAMWVKVPIKFQLK
ncbi:MAG: energy transducer TonB [Deltaproteobacteria bacterium]|nr:energy transducer TonB [Deltaproteobacteria bacterium]